MALTASLGVPVIWPGYPANEVIATVGTAILPMLAPGPVACDGLSVRNASGVMTAAARAITTTPIAPSTARLRLISLWPSRMV